MATVKTYELTVQHERADGNPKANHAFTYEGTLQQIADQIREDVNRVSSADGVPAITERLDKTDNIHMTNNYINLETQVVAHNSELHVWFTDVADINPDLLTSKTRTLMEKIPSGIFQPYDIWSLVDSVHRGDSKVPNESILKMAEVIAVATTVSAHAEAMPLTPKNLVSYAQVMYDEYFFDAAGRGITTAAIEFLGKEKVEEEVSTDSNEEASSSDGADEAFGDFLLNSLGDLFSSLMEDEESEEEDSECGDCDCGEVPDFIFSKIAEFAKQFGDSADCEDCGCESEEDCRPDVKSFLDAMFATEEDEEPCGECPVKEAGCEKGSEDSEHRYVVVGSLDSLKNLDNLADALDKLDI